MKDEDMKHLPPWTEDEIYFVGDRSEPFVPNREELVHLAGYLADREVRIWWTMFINGQTEQDWESVDAVRQRLAHIATIVGQEAIDEMYQDVNERFGDQQNPSLWQAFVRGYSSGPRTDRAACVKIKESRQCR